MEKKEEKGKGVERVRIPEEGRDIVVKRIPDDCVHNVEKQYGQLSCTGVIGDSCSDGGGAFVREGHFLYTGSGIWGCCKWRSILYLYHRKANESPNQSVSCHSPPRQQITLSCRY